MAWWVSTASTEGSPSERNCGPKFVNGLIVRSACMAAWMDAKMSFILRATKCFWARLNVGGANGLSSISMCPDKRPTRGSNANTATGNVKSEARFGRNSMQNVV